MRMRKEGKEERKESKREKREMKRVSGIRKGREMKNERSDAAK